VFRLRTSAGSSERACLCQRPSFLNLGIRAAGDRGHLLLAGGGGKLANVAVGTLWPRFDLCTLQQKRYAILPPPDRPPDSDRRARRANTEDSRDNRVQVPLR
jgi:hypothetical protein